MTISPFCSRIYCSSRTFTIQTNSRSDGGDVKPTLTPDASEMELVVMKKQKITALDFAVAQLVTALVDDLRIIYDFSEPIPRQGINYQVSLRQGKVTALGELQGQYVTIAHTRITLVGDTSVDFIICDFYLHEPTKNRGWIPIHGTYHGKYAQDQVFTKFSCEANSQNGKITIYPKENS